MRRWRCLIFASFVARTWVAPVEEVKAPKGRRGLLLAAGCASGCAAADALELSEPLVYCGGGFCAAFRLGGQLFRGVVDTGSPFLLAVAAEKVEVKKTKMKKKQMPTEAEKAAGGSWSILLGVAVLATGIGVYVYKRPEQKLAEAEKPRASILSKRSMTEEKGPGHRRSSRSSSDERRARRSKTEAQPGSVRSSRSKEESKGAKNAKEEDKVRPSAYKRKPNPSVQRVETPDQTQAASSEPPQMGAYRSRKQNQEASPVAEAGTNGVQGTAPLKPDKEAAPETRSSSYRRKQNPAAAAAPASAETAPAEAATSEEIAGSPPSPAEQEVVPEPRSSGYRRKQNPSAAAETPPADPTPVTAPAEAATSEDVAGSAPSQVEQEVVAEPRSSAYRRKQNPSAAAETPPADPTPVAAPAEAISEDVAGSPASQTSHEEPTRTRSAYRNRKPNASEPSTPQETSDAPAPRSSSYRQRRQSSSKPRRGSRQDQPA